MEISSGRKFWVGNKTVLLESQPGTTFWNIDFGCCNLGVTKAYAASGGKACCLFLWREIERDWGGGGDVSYLHFAAIAAWSLTPSTHTHTHLKWRFCIISRFFSLLNLVAMQEKTESILDLSEGWVCIHMHVFVSLCLWVASDCQPGFVSLSKCARRSCNCLWNCRMQEGCIKWSPFQICLSVLKPCRKVWAGDDFLKSCVPYNTKFVNLVQTLSVLHNSGQSAESMFLKFITFSTTPHYAYTLGYITWEPLNNHMFLEAYSGPTSCSFMLENV